MVTRHVEPRPSLRRLGPIGRAVAQSEPVLNGSLRVAKIAKVTKAAKSSERRITWHHTEEPEEIWG